MKKILKSILTVGVVAVVAVGSAAYFSDTETSTGNTFQAGAIDLLIDNHSWYNGPAGLVERDDLSWESTDLDGHLFFNYGDLKPGDWGEDTISIRVDDNDAWVCADLYVTRNDDMSSMEPELEYGDDQENPQDIWDGELGDELKFFFWVDDGDNVYEEGEEFLTAGPASDAVDGLHYSLADSSENNVGGVGPLVGEQTYYIGKFWCYGDMDDAPVPQDGETDKGPDYQGRGPGFVCSGASTSNLSQSDRVMADISFYAVQSRHNEEFVCESHYSPEGRTVLRLENKDIDGSWDPYLNDGVWGELRFLPTHPTFDYELDVYGLVPNIEYSLIYYADGWPGNNPGAFIGTVDTDASGNASVMGDVELNLDLPDSADANHGSGAKLWVVKSSNYDAETNSMTSWPIGAETLFEWNLINYDDTEI